MYNDILFQEFRLSQSLGNHFVVVKVFLVYEYLTNKLFLQSCLMKPAKCIQLIANYSLVAHLLMI